MNARKLAKLSRLALTDEELETLEPQLQQVIDAVAAVQRVSTEGIEPTTHATGLTNVYRDDTVRASLTAEQALSGAPETELGRFKVPRVLTEEA